MKKDKIKNQTESEAKDENNGELNCLICKDKIDTNYPFCEFIHFKKKSSIQSLAFYHTECFRERLNGGSKLKELQKQAEYILNLAQDKLEN